MQQNTQTLLPPLWRRLLAVIYDLILLSATLIVATFPVIAFNGGQAITPHPLFISYLCMIIILFYGGFWRYGGQTLGMKAWHIYLLSTNTSPLNWPRILLRLMMTVLAWLCLAIGILLPYYNNKYRAWPDRISQTTYHYQPPKH